MYTAGRRRAVQKGLKGRIKKWQSLDVLLIRVMVPGRDLL